MAEELGDLRFGAFELRAAQRQLLQHGQPVVLGARAFDVLLTLVANRGRMVTKNELMAAVWPRQVVEENNLMVQVSALRKLLGASAIATIPLRGYQFTGTAEPAAPARTMETSAAEPAPAAPPAPGSAAAASVRTLYGRDAELQALRSAVARHSLVTLVGAAGMGKTTLARALVVETTGPQGITVELASLAPQVSGSSNQHDLSPLASAVAAALHLAPASGQPADRLLQHLRQLPAAQLPTLLVLDNCEHLPAAAAELLRLMHGAAPGLRILATSQVPLHLPHEHLLRLEPLVVPPDSGLAPAQACAAAALFTARANALLPGFALNAGNADDILDVCRRLEGIPLALELAAARVPMLGTAGLRDRLGERLRLLARNPAPGLARHQTLRHALDWSYSLLPPAEQQLLRQLSLFAGGFTASTAQQLARSEQVDEWAVLDGLSALVDKSLVAAPRNAAAHAAEPRFTLLETVRDYARAQLQASAEEATMARRHATLFLSLAQAHAGLVGGDQAGARRSRLESEHDNLRAALDWSTQHDPELGLRLAAALLAFWRERGHHGEGLATYAALLQAGAQAEAALRLPAHFGMGVLAEELGDAPQVQSAGEATLVLARELGDRVREVHGLALLAHAAYLRGDLCHSRERHHEILQIRRQSGDARQIAESLNNVASCWCEEGQPQQAVPLLQEALPLARSSGHRWMEAAVLQTLAEVDCAAGDFASARAYLEESLALRRTLQHKYHLANSLQGLAMVELRLGNLDSAAAALQEALGVCAHIGLATKELPCLATTAAWATLKGHGVAAATLLGVVDAQMRELPSALATADRVLHLEVSEQSHALLDPMTWQRHWRAGQLLTREEAMLFAQSALDARAN